MPNRNYIRTLSSRPGHIRHSASADAHYDTTFLPSRSTRSWSSTPSIYLHLDAAQSADRLPFPYATLGTVLLTIIQLRGPPLTVHLDRLTHPLNAIRQAQALLNVQLFLHLVHHQQSPHWRKLPSPRLLRRVSHAQTKGSGSSWSLLCYLPFPSLG